MYRPHNDEDRHPSAGRFRRAARQPSLSRAEAAARRRQAPFARMRGPKAASRLRLNTTDADRRGARLSRSSAAAMPACTGGWTAVTSFRPTTPMCVAHNTTLASKISGYVAQHSGRRQCAGQCRRRDRHHRHGDYRLAVDAARDKVATQQATVDRIGRQIVAQGATIDQAKAQLASAQAEAKKNAARIRRGSRPRHSRNSPASRRSSRRKPLAIRRPPRWQSAQVGHRRRRGQSRRAQGAAAAKRRARSTSLRPRRPRPSAICRSP